MIMSSDHEGYLGVRFLICRKPPRSNRQGGWLAQQLTPSWLARCSPSAETSQLGIDAEMTYGGEKRFHFIFVAGLFRRSRRCDYVTHIEAATTHRYFPAGELEHADQCQVTGIIQRQKPSKIPAESKLHSRENSTMSTDVDV